MKPTSEDGQYIEVTGADIMDATEKIINACDGMKPEPVMAACALLAYSVTRDVHLSSEEAEKMLGAFQQFCADLKLGTPIEDDKD